MVAVHDQWWDNFARILVFTAYYSYYNDASSFVLVIFVKKGILIEYSRVNRLSEA